MQMKSSREKRMQINQVAFYSNEHERKNVAKSFEKNSDKNLLPKQKKTQNKTFV